MIKISIKDKKLNKTLKKMKKAGLNTKPLMAQFYGKVNIDVIQNFKGSSAPADIFTKAPSNIRKKWKKLSNYTKATSRKGKGTKPLMATGVLRASMGKVRYIGNKKMIYGTPHGLSAVHHFGTTIYPVRAKALALPYPGVKGGPRDYSGPFSTFVIGRTIYKSEDGKLTPLFFFKAFVVIPARPHLTIKKKTIDNFSKMAWTFIKINADK